MKRRIPLALRILAVLLVLAALFALLIVRTSPPQTAEPLVADRMLIKDIHYINYHEDESTTKYYMVSDRTVLEPLLIDLAVAPYSKYVPRQELLLFQDGRVTDRLELYSDVLAYLDLGPGKAIPWTLLARIPALMTPDRRVAVHTYGASDPTRHNALMAELAKEPNAFFFYPYREFNSAYPSITLSYHCSDKSLDTAKTCPIGEAKADDVFKPAVAWLEQRSLLHKAQDARFGSWSPASKGEPENFGRVAFMLLNRPLTPDELEEIRRIMAEATAIQAYSFSDGPSGYAYGSFDYAGYPIRMVSLDPTLSAEQFQAIGARHGLREWKEP